MEPIVLTELGETLVFQGLWFDENTVLRSHTLTTRGYDRHNIGIHEICGGFCDLRPISKTHKAIICRVCGKIVKIPKKVDTYGKLRQWCAQEIKNKEDERVRLEMLWREQSGEY